MVTQYPGPTPRHPGECLCEPPGSGEEYCTGHCLLRAEIAGLRGRLEKCEGLLEQAHEDRERLDAALGKVLVAYRNGGFAAQISAVIQLREVMEDLTGEPGMWAMTPPPGLEQP